MRRLLLPLLCAVLLLASAARATWSIVAVNLRTGEVMVGCATCLANFNLRKWVPVVIPEVGVAAAQSLIDNGDNRSLIWDLLQLGVDPEEILLALEQQDGSHQTRQYGIVDLAGRAVTFTGTGAGAWAGGVTGRTGDIVYAIQGNVLTGAEVVLEAEAALVNTPGDMAEKLMAAMEAAAAMGGDGRCSCSVSDPTACGAPPPDFEKSAHNGFMFLARPGDDEGVPSYSDGWANGDYYLWINIANRGEGAEDPVVQMRQQYDQWRLELQGRPDALLSERSMAPASLPSGSPGTVVIELDLKDVEDNDVAGGGAVLSLVHEVRSAGSAAIRSVVDHGDGTYTVEVEAGPEPGLERFRLVVDDGIRPVHLWPPFELPVLAPDPVPFNEPRQVEGLDTPEHESMALLRRGGLAAWFLAGPDPSRLSLWVAERPDPDSPFGPPEPAFLGDDGRATWTDFWISEDERRLVLSGARMVGPEAGVEKIFQAERLSVDEPFPRPARIEELDSGAGDGGPWLSPDELEIWFHSRRGGAPALWRAVRLSPEADWYPPEPVPGLADADAVEHLHPLLTGGGTRLILARGVPGGNPQPYFADLGGDGSFGRVRALPGALQAPAHEQIPSWMDEEGGELWWTRRGRISGMGDPMSGRAFPDSLSAAPEEVSAAAGGRVDLVLEAGVERAGAAYQILGSGAEGVTGLEIAGTVLPLQRDAFTLLLLEGATPLATTGLSGHLDAQGRAAAVLELPPGLPLHASWIDRRFRFAALVRDHGSAWASSAASVWLRP